MTTLYIHRYTTIMKLLKRLERITKVDIGYLATSGAWLNGSTLLVSVLSLGIYMLAARVLSPEVYGTYQYFLSLAAVISAFTLTGMNTAVARSVARHNSSVVYAAMRAQWHWAMLPVAIAGLCAVYASTIQGNIPTAFAWVGIGIAVPLIALFNTYGAILLGTQDFKRGFLFGLLTTVPVYGAIALCMVFAPYALAILITNLGFTLVCTFFAYRGVMRTYVEPDHKTDDGTVAYGKQLSIMNVPAALASQADIIIAFHFLGPVSAALYAFSTAIPDRFGSFLKFIPTAALPRFSTRNAAEVRATLFPKLLLLAAIALGIAGTYALAAPLLFYVLFPTYMAAVPYSQVYALVIVSIVGSVAVSALTAHTSTRSLYIVNTITPIVGTVFQFFGAFFGGLWGLILAKLATNIIATILPLVLFFYYSED